MADPDPAGDLRTPAGMLALLLLATYAYFVSPPSWNENSRFDLVRSLVERRRLDIDPYEHNTGDKAWRNGHHYSDKAPGSAFLAVPAYAIYHGYLVLTGQDPPASFRDASRAAVVIEPNGREPPYLVNASFRRALYLCNLFTNALAGALLGTLFFVAMVRRLRVAPRTALACTLALAMGSLVLPYATMFYGHVLAAALLFASYFLVPGAEARTPPRRLLAAGFLAGLAVLTELPCALAAAALGVRALWSGGPRSRAALWFCAGLAGPLLLLLAYQRAAFGSPFRTGYALVSFPLFAQGMAQGVAGVGLPRPRVLVALLVGRSRGLLYLSPVLILAFAGLARWLRASWSGAAAGGRADALLASAVVLAFLLLNSGYYMWYGGSALGPRHLIPALPFLCLGLPFALARTGRPGMAVMVALLAVSAANQLAATAVEPAAPMVPDVLRDHVYLHLLRGEVPAADGPANLGVALGLRGPLTLAPLALVWVLGLWVIMGALPPTRERLAPT